MNIDDELQKVSRESLVVLESIKRLEEKATRPRPRPNEHERRPDDMREPPSDPENH